MANRWFEMDEDRQVLVRMRQGQSDRGVSRARLIGRDKAEQVRAQARARGWREPDMPLPEDSVLAEVFGQAR